MSDDRDRVKEATNLAELVGSYVQLRRDGAGWKCCCPWHNDKRPSLTVNPSLGLWRCWVCDLGGDCFEWVMRMDGCDFRSALELLAEKAGIKLSNLQSPQSQKRRSILEVLEAVAAKFESSLNKPCADYLTSRKISAESIKRWRLGTCVPWGSLGIEESLLIDAGVIGITANSRKYDRFGDRLMFPIADPQGRVIAFGGRVLPGQEGKIGKYVNSPETDLFKKSKTLYGVRQSRDGIRRRKSVIVMEGYTDVIISHQAGVDNAVACLGTAFTLEHLKQLTTLADKIVIVLDGDEAGQSRSDSITDILVKTGTPASLVTIPGGDDPADWILKFGARAFELLVSRAVDPIQFRMKRICRGIDLRKDTAEASTALNAVLDLLSQCDVGLVELAVGSIAVQFGVTEAAVMRRLADKQRARAKNGGDDPDVAAKLRSATKMDLDDRLFIAMLVNHPESVEWFKDRLDPNWLTRVSRAVWSVYDYAEVQGMSLDWQSVCQSLPVESEARKYIEAVATWLNMAASCGRPVPKSNDDAQARVIEMARSFEAARGPKVEPFAEYF